MATLSASSKMEFDAIPDVQFDAIPDQPVFDAIPDEVSPEIVAQEAQQASLGAVQALDVMGAPQQLDWSGVRGDIDRQRFEEAQAAEAQALAAEERGSGTGPGSEAFNWRREADFQRGRISPDTEAGRTLSQQGRSELQTIEEVSDTATRRPTPSEMISGFVGQGLAPTVSPIVDSAARNLGPAAGGALGAALWTLPGGGPLAMAAPMLGGFLGAMTGGGVQEEVLKSTETPEETEERRQRAAEDFARNPGLSRVGAAAASGPFFGPSLAQFGRAATGDRGAIRNLGIAGLIGGGMEVVPAMIQRRTADAEDIAAGIFSNMIMNEPTRLGRRLGFTPSTEQSAVEAAQKYRETPPESSIPIGQSPESDLATRGTTSTADVFAGVPRRTIDEAPVPPEVVPPTQAPEQVQSEVAPPATEVPPSPEVVPVQEAVASEASKAPADLPGATSNKEAVVNAERAARDLDPIIKEARITNAESIDRARQVIQQNPRKPLEIITRLQENPQERTISLEDSAVLLVERAKLNSLRDELLNRAVDESLTPTERATAKSEFQSIEGDLNYLDQAAQDARSTWGRFGQLWQQSRRQDFTPEALESRARLAKGEALNPEESAQVREVAKGVEAAQKIADEVVAQAEARQVEKAVDNTIAEIAKQPDPDPVVRSLADRIVARLDANAEAARMRLRKRLQNLGSIPDPVIVADFAVLAASKIGKGIVKSGQWVAEMVKEFGESSRPYLQAAWEAANAKVDQMVNASTGDAKKRTAVKQKIQSVGQEQERVITALANRIQEGESLDSLGNYVDKLVDTFVRGGVRDRGSLVSSVKGVLEPLSPGITDSQIAELISGYGKSTQLSKDPLKVIKRDLKGQLQQVTKLEKLAAGEPLKKTGPERRTASDEERRLIKQVNEAKKAAGVTTTDPATQLKSTMDSARTRFGNDIKDLTFQIETGERPPTRTPVEYDQDIQVMRGLRDRLKQTVSELDVPTQMTEEQRIRITTRGLLDSISALENRIAGQQPKAQRNAPDTPEIRTLKARRDALKEQLNEVNAADSLLRENRKAEALVRSIVEAEATLSEGAQKPPTQQGPESQLVSEARTQLQAVRDAIQAKRDADPVVQQERMDAAEASVERAIKKLDEQLQAGDITATRAPSPAASQRLEDLRMQRDALNRLRNQLRIEARPKPNPLDVAIKARKTALKRQEADYLDRISREEFGPRVRKEPVDISGDKDALDALARVQTAKDEFAALQKQWELKNRTRTEKVLDGIKATWDAARNLKLSMDLSAPLQTAFAMAAHPVEGSKALGKGARAFAEQLFRNSDTYAKRVEQQIINSPNNKNGVYKAMKLDLSEVTGNKREENAGSILERLSDLESRWQDIPDFVKGLIGMDGQKLVRGASGIAKAAPKIVGLGIKASNAGFGAIANHMRARTADAMLARWYRRRGQAPTKQQLELLGNQINASTGKGGLKGEEGIRALLFAPNYYLSILKQLSFQPALKAGVKHQGKVAREILEEYVRAAATVTAIGALQYLFGNREDQTLDPRAHDFARAKTNQGTSLDFTMGRGAYATLVAQLVTGEKIDRKGRVVKQDRSQAFLSFLKGRLSREISTGLTTAAGTDFRGKPLDTAGLSKEIVTPLSWQDVDQVLEKEGMTRGTFIQMLNLLGVTHRLED